MYPGISLTYDDLTTLARDLDVVVEALGGTTAMVEKTVGESGDDGLSVAISDFGGSWSGKRASLVAQVSGLQDSIATIVQVMADLDQQLATSVESPGCVPVPALPDWPQALPTDLLDPTAPIGSARGPYPWKR